MGFQPALCFFLCALCGGELPSMSSYVKKGHHPSADDGPWYLSFPAYFIR